MLKRWLVKRRLLVVLEVYTRIYGQQRFGKCWCVARSQPTFEKIVVNYYSRKIFSYVFGVGKYFYNENKANYGISYRDGILIA